MILLVARLGMEYDGDIVVLFFVQGAKVHMLV